jgi:hypothetical protein
MKMGDPLHTVLGVHFRAAAHRCCFQWHAVTARTPSVLHPDDAHDGTGRHRRQRVDVQQLEAELDIDTQGGIPAAMES